MIDRRVASPRALQAKVCVVGSGAGGAAAATELSLLGIDTVLVEEGPHHDPESFNQREATMMDRLYMEGGQRLSADQSVLVLSGRGLGGSTIHNTGLCVPPPRSLLERWKEEGALAPSVAEVEQTASETLALMGARQPGAAEHNRNNRLLEEGARALGLEVMHPLHNRSQCSGCGYCILGCAYNRKRHVLFSHLERGVAAGLRILTNGRVDRVRPRAGGGFDVDGSTLAVRCDKVVLAASALGTPVLLQRSGLGRRGTIGRSLRLHPFAPVGALFEEPVEAYRGIPQSVLVTGRADFMRSGRGGYVLMAGAAGPAGTAALLPGFGASLGDLMRRFRHLAVAGVLLHDQTRGRVSARKDGVPRIRYWPNQDDQATLRDGIATLARLYFAAGASRVILPFRRACMASTLEETKALISRPFRPFDLVVTSVHPQGSVPLGRSDDAPANPEGELKQAPGIFIADASLFPGSIGVPPQVTIMALATLGARRVATC